MRGYAGDGGTMGAQLGGCERPTRYLEGKGLPGAGQRDSGHGKFFAEHVAVGCTVDLGTS